MASVLDMSNSTALFAAQASEASAAFSSRFITVTASLPTASQAMSSAYAMVVIPQLRSTPSNSSLRYITKRMGETGDFVPSDLPCMY